MYIIQFFIFPLNGIHKNNVKKSKSSLGTERAKDAINFRKKLHVIEWLNSSESVKMITSLLEVGARTENDYSIYK